MDIEKELSKTASDESEKLFTTPIERKLKQQTSLIETICQ